MKINWTAFPTLGRNQPSNLGPHFMGFLDCFSPMLIQPGKRKRLPAELIFFFRGITSSSLSLKKKFLTGPLTSLSTLNPSLSLNEAAAKSMAVATMQDRRPWPWQAKETTAHAGWALVSVPGAGAGRCMDAWHSRKCPCHSAELEPSAPPSPPCMHGMATASPVSAGCRGDDDRRRHVAHPGRRPAGMPFSGDRATARNQCEQQGKAFHVERARGKLRRNLHDGPSSGLSGIRIME